MSDADADAAGTEMAQPAPPPPPPPPPPIDLTLEELLSQFDDDVCRSPPPPMPPTNSLEQYDYIEELDRLLLQHDDAQRLQAQAQIQVQQHQQQPRRDCGLAPIDLPPPGEEAVSFGEERNVEAGRAGEEGSALPPLLLLPPPDEYKDMDEVAVQRPSLLLQALAAPVVSDHHVLHPGETVGSDNGAASAHFESGFADAGDSELYERRQEQTLELGSVSLTVESVAAWSSGEAYGDGELPAQCSQYLENLKLFQVQEEQRAPKTAILSDLTKYRPDKFKARIQGEVPSRVSCQAARNCPGQFNPRSPSVSPYSRALFPMAPPSVADTDSGIESVSSLSPPDADGEMSPMCSPRSSTNISLSLSPKKPAKLQSISVLSTILSQEPEPTRSSTLLNSLLIISNNNNNNNNNIATSATPNPISILSITEAAEDPSSVEAAVCSLKVLAINPKEMTLSKEEREAQGMAATSETADLFESIGGGGGGDDPTGLSFLQGDEVPIRSALEDEDATSRLARRKRSASEIEEPRATEPEREGWAIISCSLSLSLCLSSASTFEIFESNYSFPLAVARASRRPVSHRTRLFQSCPPPLVSLFRANSRVDCGPSLEGFLGCRLAVSCVHSQSTTCNLLQQLESEKTAME